MKVSETKALDYMHGFNVRYYDAALGEAANIVLFSARGFDVTKLDPKKTFFGSPYPDGSIELNKEIAKPAKMVFKDVDGDGLEDAVITFQVKGATALTVEGVLNELYLFAVVDGKPTAAFETVRITQ